jgi:hypothetical protein
MLQNGRETIFRVFGGLPRKRKIIVGDCGRDDFLRDRRKKSRRRILAV